MLTQQIYMPLFNTAIFVRRNMAQVICQVVCTFIILFVNVEVTTEAVPAIQFNRSLKLL